MTDSLAQQEADRYFAPKDRITAHPEDTSDSDTNSDIDEKSVPPTELYHSDPDDDDDTLHSMSATTTATYHLPETYFNANTGPKGVIADARSFDRAKKQSLRNAFRNLTKSSRFQGNSMSQTSAFPSTGSDATEKSGSGMEGDEDDEFMEQWRQKRLKELSAAGSQKQPRRPSPSKRQWGFLKKVDANGYLDAVEQTAPDMVVVVCIYDPESDESAAVEASLHTLAEKHATTRFVKLHHEIAEMEHVGVPAIIAYQNGDVIATLADCSAVGLETNLRRNGVLVDTAAY